MEGAFLSAGDSRTDVQQALALDVCSAPGSVREMGVATIDDDVALIQQGDELVDKIIDCGTGLDHQEHLAGALQGSHEILEAVCAVDILACAAAFDEFVNLGNCTIENTYMEAFALHVEDKVLTHDGKTDKSYV